MKIDKVYFICMKPKNDRYWAQQGANGVMGVPIDKLECFQGVNGKDEKFQTFHDISQAMVDDGFEAWKLYQEKEEWPQYGGPQSLAIQWTHLRALRHIADRGENAIVLEDDTFLYQNFFEIERGISQLPDVRCVFLWWTFFYEHDPNFPYDQIMKQHIRETAVEGVFTGYVPCGCKAKFYTAEGARDYIEAWSTAPEYSCESSSWARNKMNPTLPGYYFCFPMWAVDLVNRMETISYKF